LNDSERKHNAAQALRALQLRRQLEQGEVTHEEYLARLNALQSSDAGPTPPTVLQTPKPPLETMKSQSAPTERDGLMSALEVLQLRRRLDKGELTQQQYQAQLHAGPQQGPVTPETPLSPHVHEPSTPIPTPPTSTIMGQTHEALPVRHMAMKCPSCAAELRIYDQTLELQCGYCGVEVLVERKNCTISLRLVKQDKVAPETDPRAAKADELAKLQAEVAMLITVKRVAGLLGVVSTALFTYTGIADLKAQHTVMATGVLFCGCALLGMVVFITRHTSNARAQLAMRIRALTTTWE
jgi:DNA-directed RNA polymerase subunit RPC12/RpoP